MSLAKHLSSFVKMPAYANRRSVHQRFHDIAQFPTVIGLIDCTHVRVTPPKEIEHIYVNRKSVKSYNIQCVCDDQGKFINIVASWPGSTHDSRIYKVNTILNFVTTLYEYITFNSYSMFYFSVYPVCLSIHCYRNRL